MTNDDGWDLPYGGVGLPLSDVSAPGYPDPDSADPEEAMLTWWDDPEYDDPQKADDPLGVTPIR